MKVSCQACGAKYTIADDKVRGRKVKIRCKSCGAPIVVDAQSEAPPPAEASPAAPAPAASAPKTDAWSVNLSDTDQRNMTTEEIVAGWKSGVVTSDAFVWKEGMGDWVAILECAEISAALPANEAPADPSATPFGPTIVTAQPSKRPRKKAFRLRVCRAEGPGVASTFSTPWTAVVGPEEDVATSAPAFPGMAGTQPYDDGKMTGARNENSVLFSLDALKGGLTAEPVKKVPPPRSAPVASDPLVSSAASVLGSGASPLFSLSADQALLTAPAPVEPPPRAVEDRRTGTRTEQARRLRRRDGGGGRVARRGTLARHEAARTTRRRSRAKSRLRPPRAPHPRRRKKRRRKRPRRRNRSRKLLPPRLPPLRPVTRSPRSARPARRPLFWNLDHAEGTEEGGARRCGHRALQRVGRTGRAHASSHELRRLQEARWSDRQRQGSGHFCDERSRHLGDRRRARPLPGRLSAVASPECSARQRSRPMPGTP